MSAIKWFIAAGIACLLGACSNQEATGPMDDGESTPESTDTMGDGESTPEPADTMDDDESTPESTDTTGNDLAGPTPPPPIVRFYPIDLTTALDTTLPEARIDWEAYSVPMELLQALAASITLRTWPELGSVPMRTVIEPDYLPNTSRIAFGTTAPLPDRWYALHVSSLPSGLAWPYYQYRFELPDGAVVIRFRPGSQPSFRSLRMCSKGGGDYSFGVYFTEPVLTELPITDLVRISQSDVSGLHCNAGDMPATGSESVEFACSGLDPGRPSRLDIETGLVSASGVPVTDLAENPTPLAYVLSWDDMIEGEPGCRMFMP